MLKMIREHICMGLAIGSVLITINIWLGIDGVGYMSNADARDILMFYSVWLAASALYGLSGLIYEIKRIPQLLLNAIHLTVCFAITAVGITILGFGSIMAKLLIVFIITYIIIGIVVFAVSRIETRQINKNLQNRKKD